MADTDTSTSDLNYADTLWKAADTLRGQIDAAEYKHVVLGLLFLKYIWTGPAFTDTRVWVVGLIMTHYASLVEGS